MRDNVVQIRQIGQEIACVECGAVTHSACECGAAYMPAGARAAEAVAATPHRSNRAIAADLGVSEGTVRTARQSTAQGYAVDRRVGLDGKARRLPQREEPPEEADQEDALEAMSDRGWLNRAMMSAQYARYAPIESCPKTSELLSAVRDAVEAWTSVLRKLERKEK